jgi:hypothetical protein
MSATDRILKALEKHGSLTAREVAGHAGIRFESSVRLLKNLRRAGSVKVTGHKPIFHSAGVSYASVYEATGREPPVSRYNQGFPSLFVDDLPIETEQQALHFKLRLLRAHPHGYTSFKPTPDSLRCDLRRDAVGAASSLV